MSDVHVNDTNTRFKITLVDESNNLVDLSDASLLEIKFFKPDNTVVVVTANLFTDGTDGTIYYDTGAGDLDTPGVWKYQAHLILPTGEKHSSILSVRVKENLG